MVSNPPIVCETTPVVRAPKKGAFSSRAKHGYTKPGAEGRSHKQVRCSGAPPAEASRRGRKQTGVAERGAPSKIARPSAFQRGSPGRRVERRGAKKPKFAVNKRPPGVKSESKKQTRVTSKESQTRKLPGKD